MSIFNLKLLHTLSRLDNEYTERLVHNEALNSFAIKIDKVSMHASLMNPTVHTMMIYV